jgi:O-antigen/teichoic acid export membrane protein
LARGLGPDGYGTYAFALSVASLIGIIAEFGVPQVALRESSVALVKENWGLFRGVAQFGVGIVAASSIAMVLLLELALRMTPLNLETERRATLDWALLFVPLAAQAKIASYMLMGLGKVVMGQFTNLVLRPGMFALLLAISSLGWGGFSAQAAMILQVIGAGAALVCAGVLLVKNAPSEAWRTPAQINARAWLAASWPMAMSAGLSVAQGQMSVLLLGALNTSAETGLFRVADSTANICGLAASLLNAATISMFANLWAREEREELQRLVSVSTLAIAVGTLLVTLPIVILGRFLLGPIFGASFVDSYPTLLISCCSNLAFGFFGLGGSLLNMTGYEKRVMRAIAISLTMSLFLSLLLIPWLGSRGAALANLAGVFGWNYLTWRDCGAFLRIDTSLLESLRKWRGRGLSL